MNDKPIEPGLAQTSENWGSKLGVILAVAGSAVGLGNFLRFPGNAALNGGGVFMIPYFISMLVIGIPICWVEWTMGRYAGSKGHNSAPGIFAVLWGSNKARYLGVLALIVPVVIYMYYVYIEAWCLSYALDYLTGTMGRLANDVPRDQEMQAYKQHWDKFVGVGANGIPGWRGLLILGSVFVINFFLIFRGLTKGIELFCKIAMPLLILIALVILVRVLTLPPQGPEANINNALGYMWNPTVTPRFNWEQVAGPEVELAGAGQERPSFEAPAVNEPTMLEFLVLVKGGLKGREIHHKVLVVPAGMEAEAGGAILAVPGQEVALPVDADYVEQIKEQPFWTALMDPELWLVAAGQIFFSLSVGFGIILNYSSYLRPNDDVALSALTASATNEFTEVCLGGLIIVPVAWLFLGQAGLNADVLDSSFQLGFVALPAVFHRMPLGDVFGGLFFFMLFIAAVTSSLSMLQPAIAFLEQGFDLGRRASVACLCLIVAMGGLVVIFFSKDTLALGTMDYWVGTVCIFLLATLQVITVGWVFGIDRAKKELQRGAEIKVPRIFWFVIKWVSPIYLLVIFAGFCFHSLPAQVENIMKLDKPDRDTVVFVLIFLFLLIAFFGVLVHLAGKRWQENRSLPEEVKL